MVAMVSRIIALPDMMVKGLSVTPSNSDYRPFCTEMSLLATGSHELWSDACRAKLARQKYTNEVKIHGKFER